MIRFVDDRRSLARALDVPSSSNRAARRETARTCRRKGHAWKVGDPKLGAFCIRCGATA